MDLFSIFITKNCDAFEIKKNAISEPESWLK